MIYNSVFTSPIRTITVIPKKWRDSNANEYIYYQWQGAEEAIIDNNPYYNNNNNIKKGEIV